jgi:hypothetical protein
MEADFLRLRRLVMCVRLDGLCGRRVRLLARAGMRAVSVLLQELSQQVFGDRCECRLRSRRAQLTRFSRL